MQIPTEFQPHLALSNDLGYDTRTGHYFVDLYAYSNVTSTVVRPVPLFPVLRFYRSMMKSLVAF
jgi:hypothetical protein